MTANLCVRCGRPTPDGYGCSSCANLARRQLVGDPRDDDFIGIADAMPAARDIAHGQARRGCVGGGAGGPGIPFDPDALERLDAVQNTLTTLARDIAETRGIDVPNAGREDPVITAAHFVADQTEWIRHAWDGTEPYASRAFREIGACSRAVIWMARGSVPKRYLGPCGALILPESDEQGESQGGDAVECSGDVYAREEWDQKRHAYVVEDSGRCQACRTRVVTAERQAWLDETVRDYAFRASEIAQAYDINVNTIRSWAARGQLVPHGHDADERPLFNVGEVLDLAAADAARRATEQAKRARRRERSATDEGDAG